MRSPAAGHDGAKSQKAQGTKEHLESTLPWNLDQAVRTRIEHAIQFWIDVLDNLDRDPDFEPDLGALENHPCPPGYGFFSTPGSHRGEGDQTRWAAHATDREHDADHEPDDDAFTERDSQFNVGAPVG